MPSSPKALDTPPTDIKSSDLPPSRPKKRLLTKVTPPLHNLGLNNLIYIVSLLAVLLIAFYTYRIVSYKSQVGGWWNLALGKRPPQLQDHTQGNWDAVPPPGGRGKATSGGDVEDRINALAEALGMPPKELASAIAGVVREYVPPASLSSVSSAAAKATGKSSDATKVLLGGEDEQEDEGVMGTASSILGSVVGLDEPLNPET